MLVCPLLISTTEVNAVCDSRSCTGRYFRVLLMNLAFILLKLRESAVLFFYEATFKYKW